MPPNPDDTILALARQQHGVVTRGQLLAAGLTARMVEHRLGASRLRTLHRGVYVLETYHMDGLPDCAQEMAAVLACGHAAVVSHRSAARLLGLMEKPERTTPVEVTIPQASRRRRPGIHIHRAQALTVDHATRIQGIPVTTAARTLCDLSTVLGSRALNRMAARAERLGLVDAATLSRLPGRRAGRPGASSLRSALEMDGGPKLIRSEAEERFFDLIRESALAVPETNVMVLGHEVDFYWRAAGLVVEVDGYRFHASRRSFENDRRRDAELSAGGLRVMRVTWRQIVEGPTRMIVRLAQALAQPVAFSGVGYGA